MIMVINYGNNIIAEGIPTLFTRLVNHRLLIFISLFKDILVLFSRRSASSLTDSRETTCFCGEALLIQKWPRDRGLRYFYLTDWSIDFYSFAKADILSMSQKKIKIAWSYKRKEHFGGFYIPNYIYIYVIRNIIRIYIYINTYIHKIHDNTPRIKLQEPIAKLPFAGGLSCIGCVPTRCKLRSKM